MAKVWYLGGYKVTHSMKQKLSVCSWSEVTALYEVSTLQIHPQTLLTASLWLLWVMQATMREKVAAVQVMTCLFSSVSPLGRGRQGPSTEVSLYLFMALSGGQGRGECLNKFPGWGTRLQINQRKKRKIKSHSSLFFSLQLLLQLSPSLPLDSIQLLLAAVM